MSGKQAAQVQELVIDNFTNEVATLEEFVNDSTIIRRAGDDENIIGGVRETNFGVTPIPGSALGRKTVLDIPGTGKMFLESGVHSAVGLTFFYGNDIEGNLNPLNGDLQGEGYDRFRIEFASCDVEVNYLIQVFDGDGNYAILSGSQSTADRASAFYVDFIFDEFAPGAPNPVNWNDIDGILVLFQTGNAAGGQDFAVNRIVALPQQ
jgi:hypothetical protein